MSLYRIIKNSKTPDKFYLITYKDILNEKTDNISDKRNFSTNNNDVARTIIDKEKIFNEAYKKAKIEITNKIKKEYENKIMEEQIKLTNRYKNMIKKIIKKYMEKEKNREKEFINNMITIIKKVIDDNKLIDIEVLKNSIQKLLKKLKNEKKLLIKINPDDYIELKKDGFISYILNEYKTILKIEKDENIKSGDFIIETQDLILKNVLEEKLNVVKEKLQKGERLDNINSLIREEGKVKQIVGMIVEVEGLKCSVGDICEIKTETNKKIFAEVVGYRDKKNLLIPLSEPHGIGPESKVIDLNEKFEIGVSENLLGRVIDGFGRPIDGKGIINYKEKRNIYGREILPLERDRIKEPILTGIRSIDLFLTCGKGQRMGIFSGSGVGKSTILGMMARNTNAQINVIALIGERGREVKDFIEKDLGESGLKKSIVIASTSDKSPLERVHGAFVAVTIAEFFKDLGYDVLLMMDSVTRFAMAQREIGLAIGEPPSSKGYTPSVFSKLPKLLERAGNFVEGGSITGFYTVLVEGDDMNEPIADAIRSILDGHIVLSRKLASKNHYPSVDITASISRVMPDIVDEEKLKIAGKVKEIISIVNDMEDLVNIGAYKKGANPKVDYAYEKIEFINKLLRQGINEKYEYIKSFEKLKRFLSEGAKNGKV